MSTVAFDLERTEHEETHAPTEEAIVKLLEMRHSTDGWATFPNLRAGTGFASRGEQWARRIDFFAFNTWPSSRFLSIAYEIKVSRADFFRELEQPDKRTFAEKVAAECYFAAPAGMVRPDEIPEGWGLLEVTRGGLRRKKAARQRRPDPWPWPFVASIARRGAERVSAPTSQTLWCYAGQTVDVRTLLKIAEEMRGQTIEAERDTIANHAVAAFKRDPDYTRMFELALEVRRRTGCRTAEEFVECMRRADTGLTPGVIRTLQQAQQAIAAALGKEE